MNSLQQALQALQQGKADTALTLCNEVLKTDAGNVNALLLLSHAQHLLGQNQAAMDALIKLLEIQPDNMDGLNNLAILYEQGGQFVNAEVMYRKAMSLQPNDITAIKNLGDLYRQMGRPQQAIEVLQQALKIEPNSLNVLNNLAITYQGMGEFEQAKSLLEKALGIAPQHESSNANMGAILYLQKEYESTLPYLEKAIQQNPHNFSALNSLAACLSDLQRLDEAGRYLQQAQALAPNATELLINYGKWHMLMGHLDEALDCFDKVEAVSPNNIKARWHRSFVNLLLGKYAQGWDDYAAGIAVGERVVRQFAFPLWQGESLQDKTLLIHAEQGIGDEIMFASCVPDLVDQAGKIILECDPRLTPLFERSFDNIEVMGGKREQNGTQLSQRSDIDFQIPCGSLPQRLRRRLEDFPGNPFLRADEQGIEKWRQRYSELGTGLKIGISWRAGMKIDYLQRSMPLEQWLPLLQMPNIILVNLQYGDHRQEIDFINEKYGITIHHWPDSDPLKEQDDFAAQLCALDLVVSVSNATVHLAGALGVKTFNLLPYVPSWRWTTISETTPWYDSVCLCRQPRAGDWDSVIQSLIPQIEALA